MKCIFCKINDAIRGWDFCIQCEERHFEREQRKEYEREQEEMALEEDYINSQKGEKDER